MKTKIESSVKSVTIVVEPRTINFPKHVKTPDGVVTKFARKRMYDVHITTKWIFGTVKTETFVAHKHRGELRIIVPATSKYDKPQSMPLWEFERYAVGRWVNQIAKVMFAFTTLE